MKDSMLTTEDDQQILSSAFQKGQKYKVRLFSVRRDDAAANGHCCYEGTLLLVPVAGPEPLLLSRALLARRYEQRVRQRSVHHNHTAEANLLTKNLYRLIS